MSSFKKNLTVSLLLFSFLMISGSELFHHHENSESSSHKPCSICLIQYKHCGECKSIDFKIHDRDFEVFSLNDSDSEIHFIFYSNISDRAPPLL